MRRCLAGTAVALCMGLSVGVHAEDNWVDGVVYFGLHGGGDEVALVEVGQRRETKELRLGDAFSANIGLELGRLEVPLQLQATIGYSFAKLDGVDGMANIDRWAAEAIAFWTTGRIRVGVGRVYHADISLEYDTPAYGRERYTFDDAAGLVYQEDFQLNEDWAIGVRHVRIDYVSDAFVGVLNANSTGAQLTLTF